MVCLNILLQITEDNPTGIFKLQHEEHH